MFKLAGLVLDQFDDPKLSLVSFTDIPERFRELPVHAPDEMDKLAQDDYAVFIQTGQNDFNGIGKYPIKRAGDAILSLRYFEKTASHLPPEARAIAGLNIKNALARHGLIDEPIEKMASSNIYDARTFDKDQLPKNYSKLSDDNFALITDNGKLFPIHKKAGIEAADIWFQTNYQKLMPNVRVEMATRMEKKASELGVKLTEYVKRYVPSNEVPFDISHRLEKRASYIEDKEDRATYMNLLDYANKVEPKTLADAMYEIEKKSSMPAFYDMKIEDPYIAIFTEDKSPKDEIIKISGEDFRMSDIKGKLKDEGLVFYLGKEACENLEKDFEGTFAQMKTMDKDLLAMHLKGSLR